MPKEIERKFLVANELWRNKVQRHVKLRDGLLAFSDGRKVRIRFYDDRATLTVKGRRNGISRDEFEYDIPSCDGLVLLEDHCDREVLEKTRYHLIFEGFDWTIDEYHGLLSGVMLAEIELPSEDAKFSRPPWLGPEVTGKQKYRQTNLVKAFAHRKLATNAGE
ncbi:CYTH domain-containing protein [Paracoccus laeviglucosivorans]|uniref:CYTH domain-containing protein n=1 Tax=Paracoccus laeviglucosivorans TaxID=1197861 RepID=A0A521EAQ9_9RHOB|nr:CYTH domain-containing protein [Paracoccus laeviglucosivorans]SMO81009.1 CYTH domain-containing protein [Paracoccus laeviglucosivorans]